MFAGSYFVTFWLLKDKHNFIYKKKAFKRLLYCFKNIPVVSLRKLSETLPIPYKVMRSMLENNRLHWPPRPIKHQLKRTFYPSPTISEIGPESPNLYSRRSFRVQILMTNDWSVKKFSQPIQWRSRQTFHTHVTVANLSSTPLVWKSSIRKR